MIRTAIGLKLAPSGGSTGCHMFGSHLNPSDTAAD
jgi:hypothetical protein